MNRDMYGSAKDYIIAFIEATTIAIRLEVSIGAYPFALILLHNLRSDLPVTGYGLNYGYRLRPLP
jgi:hypothetical protein